MAVDVLYPAFVHEYYFHYSININVTWESKIQMMGLELGNPATPLLAQTLVISWTNVAKLSVVSFFYLEHHPICLLVYFSV